MSETEETRQPDEKSRLENLIEGEGDAIDRSTLPEGLGGEEQQQSREPETVTVNVGGQSFQVPKDLAEAYQSQVASFQEQMERARRPEPEPEPHQETDWDALWWSDPKAAKAAIAEEIKKELRAEYGQERQRERFWQDFYDENPGLRGKSAIVNAVMQEEWAQLQNLPSGKSTRDKLASMTKELLLTIGQEFRPRPVEGQDLESGRGPAVGTQQRPQDRPGSISSYLKERAASRQGQSRSEG